jgi:hypothetical protein
MIEIAREAATIVMLAAIALAVASNAAQWTAAFAIAFGTWDIMFYVFLKLLLDWPASLLTWDILFLIPIPWVEPVLTPVIVSVSMIAAGLWRLQREASGERVRLRVLQWIGIVLGAFVIIVSFTLDHRNTRPVLSTRQSDRVGFRLWRRSRSRENIRRLGNRGTHFGKVHKGGQVPAAPRFEPGSVHPMSPTIRRGRPTPN